MPTTTQDEMKVYTGRKRTHMLMTYRGLDGRPVAKVWEMKEDSYSEAIYRVLRWASNHGVEVTFRPQ